jgi:uncharacterized membrane protein
MVEEPMKMDGVTDDDKLWAALAYVFTPLIPIILMLMEDKKARPYIKAHNGQALAWGVLNVILSVTISPFLCGIPSIAMWLVTLYWGYQAYQGQAVTIPFLTDFVKQQGWA